MIAGCDVDLAAAPERRRGRARRGRGRARPRHHRDRVRCRRDPSCGRAALAAAAPDAAVPVLGITGTGGSGKSSLTDELVRRLRLDQEDKLRVAVLAVDPTRRRGGGALLGDRIRMNALAAGRTFFRSLATRGAPRRSRRTFADVVDACRAAGYDLVIVETPGIGQGDSAIVDLADVSLYVMTPEYGAASQLEKIDMLDLADAVAINKFERRGGEDALPRRRPPAGAQPEPTSAPTWHDMPVFGTSAARFDDDGVTALYQHLRGLLGEHGLAVGPGTLPAVDHHHLHPGRGGGPRRPGPLPRRDRRHRARLPRAPPSGSPPPPAVASICARPRPSSPAAQRPAAAVDMLAARADADLDQPHPAGAAPAGRRRRGLPGRRAAAVHRPRAAAERRAATHHARRAAQSPGWRCHASRTTGSWSRFLRAENLPGRFPFTAGVFPVKRDGEAPSADVRRRGRRLPHQPALPPAVGRPAGDPAVHRVRLGHAVRARPGPRGPTSTARSAPPASPSPPWTT